MTYNVFDGTLNLAQANPILKYTGWAIKLEHVQKFETPVHDDAPVEKCSVYISIWSLIHLSNTATSA